MLLFRSISSLQICVVISSIIVVKCQYYNPDYRVSDDLEDEEHSSYKSEDNKPDYSKYYNSEGASSPLIGDHFINAANDKESESGFVSPLDFSGFLSSSQFGASSKQEQSIPAIALENPFHFQDALKKQNSSGFVDSQEFSAGFSNAPNFELEVGKHFSDNTFEPKIEQPYVAPKAASYKSQNTKANNYNSEVDDLNGYEAPKYKKPLKKTSYTQNLNYNKPKTDFSGITSKYNAYIPVNPPLASYSTGKINHLAPVKTYVPQYFPPTKHTNTQTSQPTYQNYNFQPISGLSNIKSSSAPIDLSPTYNIPHTSSNYYSTPSEFAQPSEYKSQKVQNSNCQKIEKQLSPDDISHGRFRRQAEQMNCFLCKDPKSGGTFEQCSYTSSPENDNSYFRGHAEKYSTKTYVDPDEHFRERRDTRRTVSKNKYKRNEDKAEQVDEYRNPFNYEKNNAHKFNSKPEEFDDSESYYKAPDFSHYEKDTENYKLSPEYFTDASQPKKSFSEHQSEEFKKNSENCKKVEKDSMTCMVCSNPKTGGNYEQCSYSYEPKEQKFAYVREKKFKSNEPIDEKTLEGTEPKPSIQRNKSHSQFKPKSAYFSASTKHPQVKTDEKDDYYLSHDFTSDVKDQKENVKGLGRFGKEDEQESKENKRGDYVYKLFPEYAEKESKNREIKERPVYQFNSHLPDYFTAEESKKDVDTVLEEFTKKDRSKCKKIAKDKMTCYICVDNKGIQHEECMFVSESQPVSSHIAYHEVKEFTSEPKNQKDEITADTKQVSEVKSIHDVKKAKQSFPKKVNSAPISIKEVDAEPTEYVKVVGKKPRIVRRKTNISKDYADYLPEESKESEVRQEKLEDVKSLEAEGPEGAYASELLPVYSKKHGTTLPAYMLDISEGEKIFDEVVKSGR